MVFPARSRHAPGLPEWHRPFLGEEESIMTHCDNCGGRLGMVVRRKWSWRFCKPTCKAAFEHRQHEEVRHRMRALFLKLPGFLGSGTCAATEYAATISAR